MGYFDGAMTWDGWGVNFDSLDLVSSIGSTTNFVINDYEMDNPEYIETYKENISNKAEKFSKFYGELEIYALVIDSVFLTQQNHDTPDDPVNAARSWIMFRQTPMDWRDNGAVLKGSAGNNIKPVMVQKYVVKTARDDGDLSNPINTASMTSLRDASGHATSPDDSRLYENPFYDGTALIRFKSLNGIQLAFSISNNRMPEWGVGDIDFENSFVRIYKDGVSDPVYEKQLAADASEQLLVFPDIEYESGMYYTEVALQAKISGRVDTVRFETNFYVDATEPDADAAFKTLSVFLPEIGAHEVFNGIESGEELESVVVPKGGDYQTVQFVSESYGQLGMFDVWLSGSDEAPLIINNNIIAVANDGSEAHIAYDYSEYVFPTVFVPDDEPTILYIRERLANGETGPVKQLNLSVSEYAPEL